MVSTDTPSGMSWYVPGAWRPPPPPPPPPHTHTHTPHPPPPTPHIPKYYLNLISNLHIALNISCKFHSCVKTLSHKTTVYKYINFVCISIFVYIHLYLYVHVTHPLPWRSVHSKATLLPLPPECTLQPHSEYYRCTLGCHAMDLVKLLTNRNTLQRHFKCTPGGVYTPLPLP